MIIEHKTKDEHVVVDTFKREIYLWHTNEVISFKDVTSVKLAILTGKPSQNIYLLQTDFVEIKTKQNHVLNLPVIRAQVKELEYFFDVGYYEYYYIIKGIDKEHSNNLRKYYNLGLIGEPSFTSFLSAYIIFAILITLCFIFGKIETQSALIEAILIAIAFLGGFTPFLVRIYKKERAIGEIDMTGFLHLFYFLAVFGGLALIYYGILWQ